jgi:hypothetical protein
MASGPFRICIKHELAPLSNSEIDMLTFLAGIALGMLICAGVAVYCIDASEQRHADPDDSDPSKSWGWSAPFTALGDRFRMLGQLSNVLARLDRQDERIAAIEGFHSKVLIQRLNNPDKMDPSHLLQEAVTRSDRPQRWHVHTS